MISTSLKIVKSIIVYTILEKEIVVKVIAIGPRREMVVYCEALRRVHKS